MVNYILFVEASDGGVPEIMDGILVIQNNVTLFIEKVEYEYPGLNVIEISELSRPWMAFYGFTMAFHWPKGITMRKKEFNE